MAKKIPNFNVRLEANVGERTKKGTLVTQEIQDKANQDEYGKLIIRENNVKIVEQAMKDAFLRALERIGLEAERRARALTPVDTGRLKNSVTHAIDAGERSVYIGTNVEYAPVIEFGRKSGKYKGANGGRGFLRPAANDNSDVYRKILEDEMKS